MDFKVTPEFSERYDQLDDVEAECVDDAIRRVVADPQRAWARQNRVVGEKGWAWLVVVSCDGVDFGLYWQETVDEPIVFLLLLDQ
jgi:hypothetical protein